MGFSQKQMYIVHNNLLILLTNLLLFATQVSQCTWPLKCKYTVYWGLGHFGSRQTPPTRLWIWLLLKWLLS